MATTGSSLTPSAIIDPSDPEGRRAPFEALLRSDRFAEHRRRLQAQVENWTPAKGPIPPGCTVSERSPSEEAAFRREISCYVLDTALHHCWLYYQAFLPEGDAAVRRGRAAVKATAERAALLAGELAAAVRQLWMSNNSGVREVLDPVARQHPRRGDRPIEARSEYLQASDLPPSVLGDPWFLKVLEEIRCSVELFATALPADAGGRRPSVVFEQLAVRLAGIYSGFTGNPALPSTRAGAPEGQFFRFVKAVVAWLNEAAPDLPNAEFDLPPSDDALRMALHRMVQANTAMDPK